MCQNDADALMGAQVNPVSRILRTGGYPFSQTAYKPWPHCKFRRPANLCEQNPLSHQRFAMLLSLDWVSWSGVVNSLLKMKQGIKVIMNPSDSRAADPPRG